MTLHGTTIDSSCAACHVPDDDSINYTTLEDKPAIDGSFCGNSACHSSEWQYTGFDSPMLEPVLERQRYILLNTSPYLLEGVPSTYDGMFSALFNGRCVDCHSGPNAEAGLDLSSYAAILQGNENGSGIIPGDVAGSLIVQAQSGSKDHFGQMLADELQAIEDWIASGAPES
jgi:mono/diheme cytochrome c family protein